MRMKWVMATLFCLASVAAAAQQPITIFLAGDSTMAEKLPVDRGHSVGHICSLNEQIHALFHRK